MKMKNTILKMLQYSCLLFVIFFGLVTIIGSGGSDDGGGNDNTQTGFVIAGWLLDEDGFPIEDSAWVDFGGDGSCTVDNGYYESQPVMNGEVTVTPIATNWSFTPSSRTLYVDSNMYNINFTGTNIASNWECDIEASMGGHLHNYNNYDVRLYLGNNWIRFAYTDDGEWTDDSHCNITINDVELTSSNRTIHFKVVNPNGEEWVSDEFIIPNGETYFLAPMAPWW